MKHRRWFCSARKTWAWFQTLLTISDALKIPSTIQQVIFFISLNKYIICLIFTLKMPILLVMKKKSLFESNPYLKDPTKYRDALITSVSSSTAIETGASVKSVSQQITDVSSSYFHPTPTKPESNSQ